MDLVDPTKGPNGSKYDQMGQKSLKLSPNGLGPWAHRGRRHDNDNDTTAKIPSDPTMSTRPRKLQGVLKKHG